MNLAHPVLFAYDTSIIILNSSSEEFKSHIILVFNEIRTWFNRNFLILDGDRIYFLQFFLNH
jgi:hypothetical protein